MISYLFELASKIEEKTTSDDYFELTLSNKDDSITIKSSLLDNEKFDEYLKAIFPIEGIIGVCK